MCGFNPVGRITHWSTSLDELEATGCCHPAIAWAVSPPNKKLLLASLDQLLNPPTACKPNYWIIESVFRLLDRVSY